MLKTVLMITAIRFQEKKMMSVMVTRNIVVAMNISILMPASN